MKRLSSEARKATTFATSEGAPFRPMGAVLAVWEKKPGQLGLVQADQPVARGVDHAGTDRIDADVPALEVGRPGAGERPDGRLCGAIDAPFGEAFTGDDRGVQNDGRSGGQQRKRLLNRKNYALDVDRQQIVYVLVGDFTQAGPVADTGVCEEDVYFPLLVLDLAIKAIQVFRLGDVSLHCRHVAADVG